MVEADASPTVVEVLRFEDLPADSLASRGGVVRFSDGTEGEALRWYADLSRHPDKPAMCSSARAI